MLAMLLDAPGRDLRRASAPVPQPGAGQLLLRVRACGVCRTDLHVVDGELPNPKLPLVLGHEIVAEWWSAARGTERPLPASGWACRGWPGPAACAATADRPGEPV